MSERILFIGGEQDGMYNRVSERIDEVKRDVYPKLDLKSLTGIIRRLPEPLRTEIYRRKRFNNIECFCLEGMTDDEILAKILK